ncbi:hypothetical protein PPL_00787 [Heterostelium album PN500]|uniref:Fungal lipase-type domain-containing protein n=1 Tax=Heterostelium pallidum (strain ATCC 26659 / Pp 5 / PN500) TaxID=670386 RepID=D3AXF6_HETP5|nr:hypothetical protein PPL_00787 [Heterostelium album PN500]EFA86225.1 hypothetical protein PPL_00787 [Heterostelium album PN500]|eukprot:XP_020438330.1 hypothetical protein PPL_00787 [Heterostelium album PN500]
MKLLFFLYILLPLVLSFSLDSIPYNNLIMSYASYCKVDQIKNWECPSSICSLPASEDFFNSNFKILLVENHIVIDSEIVELFGDDIQYFIASNGTNYFLTFRGTANIPNGIDDFESLFAQSLFPIWYTGSKVSYGFLGAYMEVRQKIMDWFQNLQGCIPSRKCNLMITGHSLGAALASTYNIQVQNFGSPRVGNIEFEQHYDSILPNTIRSIFSMNYIHVGAEIFINGSTSIYPPPMGTVSECYKPDSKYCSDGESVPWNIFNSINDFMYDHRSYFGFNLTTFCDSWLPSMTPSPTPTPTITQSPTPNPLTFPILTQNITSQWVSAGVTYSNIVGRFTNNGQIDILDPVFISTPNIIPISMFGLSSTTASNGKINWRLSPAGSTTQFMPKGSHYDFAYTINSAIPMNFTRVQ